MTRTSTPLLLATLVVGFTLTTVVRALTGNGQLDAVALVGTVLIAVVIAFAWDPNLKRVSR